MTSQLCWEHCGLKLPGILTCPERGEDCRHPSRCLLPHCVLLFLCFLFEGLTTVRCSCRLRVGFDSRCAASLLPRPALPRPPGCGPFLLRSTPASRSGRRCLLLVTSLPAPLAVSRTICVPQRVLAVEQFLSWSFVGAGPAFSAAGVPAEATVMAPSLHVAASSLAARPAPAWCPAASALCSSGFCGAHCVS